MESVQHAERVQSRRTWSFVIAGSLLALGFGVVAAKTGQWRVDRAEADQSALLAGRDRTLSPNPASAGYVAMATSLLVVLLVGTTLIDQFQSSFGPINAAGTIHYGIVNVPLWRSLSKGSFITSAEILMFILLLIWAMKGALARSWQVPNSPLAKSIFGLFATALIIGMGLGVVHHGQIKAAMWELRPWYYLAVVFLLTSSFFAEHDAIRPCLWTLVLGTGLKSIEGVYYYFAFAASMDPRPEAIMGHEESFFFGMFLLTTVALWVFQIRGRLRVVATVLTPLVLTADLGNSRRTASLILYVGLATLLATAYTGMPDRRRTIGRLAVVVAIGGAAYIGLFWNGSGTLSRACPCSTRSGGPT